MPEAQDARIHQERADMGGALFGLALFEHDWLRPHPALSQPSTMPGRYYERRTPAMAIGLTDRRWSWREFLATKATVSSRGSHYLIFWSKVLLTRDSQLEASSISANISPICCSNSFFR